MLLSALGMALISRRLRPAAMAAVFLSLGFCAADLRSALVDAPALERALPVRTIEARLIRIDEGPRRRLTLAIHYIEGVAAKATPRRVRIVWRGTPFAALPGDVVRLRAVLSPPPPPSTPGGFDYARMLYFQGIGGVGYAVTAPEIVTGAPVSRSERLLGAAERARLAVARRIMAAAPGQGGAIVAAAVTGMRGAISDETDAAYRDSGLAHLIAISGLNMALAAGLIFFAVRAALAAIPPLARRYPVKKWATVAALLSCTYYLFLSGGEWSAVRAYIMTAIVFTAILFDRRALSMRNVAIAAVIMLALAPEAVTHPGFQMSFAAVVALIASYEWWARRADPDRDFSVLARVRRYAVGLAATDLVAATATGPFSLYHFNQSAVYSLPANILAMPLMGLVVMPLAVIGLVLMPFGWDAPAWKFAAAGVDGVTAIAAFFSALPGAVFMLPQWPASALAALTLGGLWFCLMTEPWRLAGLLALPFAALMIASARPPDLFFGGRTPTAALVLRDEGVLASSAPRRELFAQRVWMEHAGIDGWRRRPEPLSKRSSCDGNGCIISRNGWKVSILSSPLGLSEDCARADLVLAEFPLQLADREACTARVIDRGDLRRDGAHAIWFGNDGLIRVQSARAMRGVRPWTSPSPDQ